MPQPRSRPLTPDMASLMARVALGHVTREYPNKLDHVLEGPDDLAAPSALHPIFHGSFDWHSCVHGHWLLATLLRLAPQTPEAGAIRALFDRVFTAEKVEGELAYLARPSARGFVRPYGWAWLLKLQAELLAHARAPWAERCRPLADAFVARFDDWLPRAAYPVRSGGHGNSAFALALAADYARASGDMAFAGRLQAKALAWFSNDRDAQAWEPSGEDFLSPTLMEAACLRRFLPGVAFHRWLSAFLPHAAQGEPACLFEPVAVSDRGDGKIVHLDGLNLSRAWCWREIAADLPPGDALAARATEASERHLDASLAHVAGDYMGEHWLASFALLALTSEGER